MEAGRGHSPNVQADAVAKPLESSPIRLPGPWDRHRHSWLERQDSVRRFRQGAISRTSGGRERPITRSEWDRVGSPAVPTRSAHGFGGSVANEYGAWLDRQALAARTRAAYRRWVTELLEYLDAEDELDAFLAAAGDDDRRAVLTNWRRRLVDRQLAPPTVTLLWPPPRRCWTRGHCARQRSAASRSTPRRREHCRESSCGHCSARPIACRPAATARSFSC
jgi:hypothetical protein